MPSRRTVKRWVVCGIMASSIGCHDTLPRYTETGPLAQRDSSGIRIVENAEPVHSHSWVIVDAPLVEIGDVTGRPEYEFFRVTGVARLGNGTLVVADDGLLELRWYSEHGELLGQAGGLGSGPGEFQALAGLVPLDGDSVLVHDYRLGRVSIFGPHRRFVRSFPLTERPVGRAPGGAYIAFRAGGNRTWPVFEPPTEVAYARSTATVVRYAEGAPAASTLVTVPWREFVTGPVDRVPGAAQLGIPLVREFGRSTGLAGGAFEHWIVGDNARPQVEFRSPTGELEVLARWNAQARSVTDRDVAALRRSRSGIGVPQMLLEAWDAPADTIPFFDSRILADADGNAWVGDYPWPADPGPRTLRVFDPLGVWVATVVSPQGLRLMAIGDAWALGIRQDDMGVQVVALHALEKS